MRSSSLLYAVIVCLAAIPFTGLPIASGWLAIMLLLIAAEHHPRLRHAGLESSFLADGTPWLINLGFAAAASYLVFYFTGPAQTFGVTLYGVVMFKTLANDYTRPRRLFVNLLPPLIMMAAVQIGAAVMLMSSHLPLQIITVFSSAFLVLWVLRSIALDLTSNWESLKREVHRAEQAAKSIAENQRLTLLAEELAGVSHWWLDVKSLAFSWSPGVYRIYGLDPDEPAPTVQDMMSFYSEADGERITQTIIRAITEGKPCALETQIITQSGDIRHVAMNGSVECNEEGAPVTLFGTIMDISETRRREQALHESETNFRMLADHGTDVVVWMGLDAVIRYASPSVRQYGYSPDDLIGRKTFELVHPEDLPRAMEIIRGLTPYGVADRNVRREYRVLTKDGQYVWLEGNPTLVTNPDTQEITCITTYRDITARRELEDDLTTAKLRAEEAAEIKSEFLANMSHEIRTPLTAIIGFGGLLDRMDGLSDEARTYVHRINASSDVLLELVNAVLDLSKLEQDQVQLEIDAFDPRELLDDTMAMFAHTAAAKAISLELMTDRNLPRTLAADSARLRQVLVNLVSNAIKFTDRGRVTVSASFDAAERRLEVAVTDTGVGVPPDKLDRLFQRFSQVDGSVSRKHGGTGLGLSICAKLVGLMGGGIDVTSQYGKGSTFCFWVEADEASPVVDGSQNLMVTLPMATSGLRLLVVDDVAVNREIISTLLEAADQNVTLAEGGAEAIRMAATQPFDLIFMDLQMPGTDGFEATRAIRRGGGINAATPIIALSANVLAEHRIASAEAGMNDHVAKPIVPAELLGAVEHWAGGRTTDILTMSHLTVLGERV